MVGILPEISQPIDGGDRNVGFETACDEGAYHPCPTLAIPPPPFGRPKLDPTKSRLHGLFGHFRGQVGISLGVGSGHAAMLQLRRQPVRAPTPGGRPHLDKTGRQLLIVHQTEVFTSPECRIDLVVGKSSVPKLLNQFTPEMISS